MMRPQTQTQSPPSNNGQDRAALANAFPQPAAPQPVAVNQTTAVEQSRAVAEVQAAVVAAKKAPRDMQRAIQQMHESTAIPALAERAFFRFPRAGTTVTGASIHLARELARVWGNIDYGVKELSRDLGLKQSEMLAFAWDLETNTRCEAVFIVPHKRDTKNGVKDLIDMRDVYENNANQGARRLRECLFSVLPPWFTEDAKMRCAKTNEQGGGVPLPQRIAQMVEVFGNYGVTQAQIEKRMGRELDAFTAQDVAAMQVVYRSIAQGEISVADEFPQDIAGDIQSGLEAKATTQQETQPEPTTEAVADAQSDDGWPGPDVPPSGA